MILIVPSSRRNRYIWFQKSRVDWLLCGDKSIRFFHASTIVRRKRNRIERLKMSDGS